MSKKFDSSRYCFRRLGTMAPWLGTNGKNTIRTYRDVRGSGVLKVRISGPKGENGRSSGCQTMYLDSTGKQIG